MAKRILKESKEILAPTHDQISQRAYELYRESGCIEGRDMENWLQAEAELRARNEPSIKPVTRTTSRISLRTNLPQRA